MLVLDIGINDKSDLGVSTIIEITRYKIIGDLCYDI